MLPDIENKKISKIELCASWTNTNGNVKFNHIKLKIDEDLKLK